MATIEGPLELTADPQITYWRFGGPNLEARERHPLPNDVWDAVRDEIQALRRRQRQSRRRWTELGEAIEYAADTDVYEPRWQPSEWSDYENDVTREDFEWVKEELDEVVAERDRLCAEISELDAQVAAVKARHPAMSEPMWREMLDGGGYATHTTFALDRIEAAF